MTAAWKSIESAPKDGTAVLLYFPDGYWADDRNIAIGFWGIGGGWYDSESASTSMTAFGSHPTHWRPLPDPPAEGTCVEVSAEEVIAFIKAHPEIIEAELVKNNALYRRLKAEGT